MIKVTNRGDRPIQVGSHVHFFEVNRALEFDRDKARGFRLSVPAGTAARFEPGDSREVELVALAGSREVYGLNNLTNGDRPMSLRLSRRQYAEMYGPTVGDQVRLGDTELFIQVEKDLIAENGGYGNEIKFGGGKVIRDGMGQSPKALDADCLDLIITNATIIDPLSGVIKADVGIKEGELRGRPRRNPLIQDGVDPSMVVGSGNRSDCR